MTEIAPRSFEPADAMSVTPGQHLASVSGKGSLQDSSDTELQSMVGAEEDEWTPVLSRRSKRKKGDERSSPGSDGGSTVCSIRVTTPTVIFSPAHPNILITKLSSLKVSRALELLCPECIMEVRFNYRLNLIAVDTRNSQTSGTLLKCTELCGIPVKVYSAFPRPCAIGIIRDVDDDLSEDDIAQHLRSPETRVMRILRLGKSDTLKIVFGGSKLPSYVYLGHVRHPVTEFKERPLQCLKCFGYNHRAVCCRKSEVCGRCGEAHASTECKSSQEKCVNCGLLHAVTSTECQKWRHQVRIINYAKTKVLYKHSA